MSKFIVVSSISLIAGILIGVFSPALFSDGLAGIQWEFNETARRGDVREMERLISEGADPLVSPTWAGGGGSYPLSEAASAGQPEVVEFLIKKGANVNFLEATERGLELAEMKRADAEKCVELLKAHGAKSR